MPTTISTWNELPLPVQKRIRWLEKKSYPRHLRGLLGVDDDTICLTWADSTGTVWGYLLINPYDDPDEPAGCDAWIIDFCVGKQKRGSAQAALGLLASMRRLAVDRHWHRIRMQLRPQTTGRLLGSLDHEVLGEGLGGTIDVAVNLLSIPRETSGQTAPAPTADAEDLTILHEELAQAAYPSDDSIAEPMKQLVSRILAGKPGIIEWDEPDRALAVRLVITREGEQLHARYVAWPMNVASQIEVRDDHAMPPSPVMQWMAGGTHRVVPLPIDPAFSIRHGTLDAVPLVYTEYEHGWTTTLGQWFDAVADRLYGPVTVLSVVESEGIEPQRQVAGTRSQARRYDAEDWQREAEQDLLDAAEQAESAMPVSYRLFAALVRVARTYVLPTDVSLEQLIADRATSNEGPSAEKVVEAIAAELGDDFEWMNRAFQSGSRQSLKSYFEHRYGVERLALIMSLSRHGYTEIDVSDRRRRRNGASVYFPAEWAQELMATGYPKWPGADQLPEKQLATARAIISLGDEIAAATKALLDGLEHFDAIDQARVWRVPVMLVYAIREAQMNEDEAERLVRTVRRFDIGKGRAIPTDSMGHWGITGGEIIDVFRRFGASGLAQWLKSLPKASKGYSYQRFTPSPQRTSVRRLGADIKLQQLGVRNPQQWLLKAFPKMGSFGRLCVYRASIQHAGQCSPEQFAESVNALRWLGEDGARRLRDNQIGYRKMLRLIQTTSRDDVLALASVDAAPGRLLGWWNTITTEWKEFIAVNKRMLQRVLAIESVPLENPEIPLHLLFLKSMRGVKSELTHYAAESLREYIIGRFTNIPSKPVFSEESIANLNEKERELRFLRLENAKTQLYNHWLAEAKKQHSSIPNYNPHVFYAITDSHASIDRMLVLLGITYLLPVGERLSSFLNQWWITFIASPYIRTLLLSFLDTDPKLAINIATYADACRGLRLHEDEEEKHRQLKLTRSQVRGLYVSNRMVRRALDKLWQLIGEAGEQDIKYSELSLYVGVMGVLLIKSGRHSGVSDLLAVWGIDTTAGEDAIRHVHDKGVMLLDALKHATPESTQYLVNHSRSPHLAFYAGVVAAWNKLIEFNQDPYELDPRSHAHQNLLAMVHGAEELKGYTLPTFQRIPASVEVCFHEDSLKVLPKHHPWTLSSGLQTGTCIRPGGEGFSAGEHALTSPDGAFLGILHHQKMPAGSWIWRDGPQLMVDSLDGTWSEDRTAMLWAWALGTVGQMGITRILLNQATYGHSYLGPLPSVSFQEMGIEVNYPLGSYTGDFTGKGYVLAIDPNDLLYREWMVYIIKSKLPISTSPFQAVLTYLTGRLGDAVPPTAIQFLETLPTTVRP